MDKITCDDCLDDFDLDLMHSTRDTTACENCLVDYHTCEDCEEMVHSDDMQNNIICDKCYEQNYISCSECSEIVHNNYSYYFDNINFCEDCFCEVTCRCEECGDIIWQENARYTIDSCYCDYCFDETRGGNGLILDYSYKPMPIFHSVTPIRSRKTYFYGLEVELESIDIGSHELAEIADGYSQNNDLFILKDDCSIYNGFEIVTHPCTLDYHLTKFPWKSITKELIKKGGRSDKTTTCGLHIHVNKSIFSMNEQVKIALFVHLHPDQLTFLARRSSSGNHSFVDIKSKKEKGKNESRYEAVNFQNSQTIEFRFFKGTLNHNTIKATIEIVDSICNFIKTVSISKISQSKCKSVKFNCPESCPIPVGNCPECRFKIEWLELPNISSSTVWPMYMEFINNNGYKHLKKYIKTRKDRFINANKTIPQYM